MEVPSHWPSWTDLREIALAALAVAAFGYHPTFDLATAGIPQHAESARWPTRIMRLEF